MSDDPQRSRVLLAQELGMGLWHAVLLRQLATALKSRGAEVVLAVPDPVGARYVLGSPWTVLPAPHYIPPVGAPQAFAARTFGDIIGASGWHDEGVLGALVNGWDSIAALVRPDAVVVDHSPSARLAFRGRIPVVGVGLGFTSPPPHMADFPALTSAAVDSFDVTTLLDNANALLKTREVELLACLPSLFEGNAEWVTCLSELDPYRHWRSRPALGPLEPLASSPGGDPPRTGWLAYLSAEVPETEALVTALASTGPGQAFIRDAGATLKARLRAAGADVSDAPLNLQTGLQTAALMVHHAGAGTIHQAALAGCPQLLLPRHLEQAHNAQAVAKVGAGVVATAPWERAIATALEPSVLKRARHWALVASAQVDEEAADKVAGRILALAQPSL